MYRAPIYVVLSRKSDFAQYQVVKQGRGNRRRHMRLYRELVEAGIAARLLVVTARTKRNISRIESGESQYQGDTHA